MLGAEGVAMVRFVVEQDVTYSVGREGYEEGGSEERKRRDVEAVVRRSFNLAAIYIP